MKRNKPDDLTPAQKKMFAKYEAMQRQREQSRALDAKELELMNALPDWLQEGVRFISWSGTACHISEIDRNDPHGIRWISDDFAKMPNAKEMFEHTMTPSNFIESVRRGILIVKGYTPPELEGGFRYSDVDYTAEGNVVTYYDNPVKSGTDDRVRQGYEKLKPLWK